LQKNTYLEKVIFHTQEKREFLIDKAIVCVKDNAWLGEGFYFWYDEQDAVYWGLKFKRKTGYFNIYKADVNSDKILDTVFNEEHYQFWIKQIEKAAKNFVIKTGTKPTLKEINDYFKDKGFWVKFDGILFQDISSNPEHHFVKEFQYKKRIQIAVYNYDIISNLAVHYEGKCV
jgi:hypothetical protein